MNKKIFAAIIISTMTLLNPMVVNAEENVVETTEPEIIEEEIEELKEAETSNEFDNPEESEELDASDETQEDFQETEELILLEDNERTEIIIKSSSTEMVSITASRLLYAEDLTNLDSPFSIANILSNYENYEKILTSIADSFKDEPLPSSVTIEICDSNNVIEDFSIVY
ncbi:MAG: hypothetical protein IKP29_06480 [Pseudobutyrivibrio sp.]|nr:hypothetical protein [Pseudobutyrivibrio sp.]